MDRFIASKLIFVLLVVKYLKSNMDRFIGIAFSSIDNSSNKFKIQYG